MTRSGHPYRQFHRRDIAEKLVVKLGVAKGDTIYAVDQPDGMRLTTADPEFAAQLEIAREVMKREIHYLGTDERSLRALKA